MGRVARRVRRRRLRLARRGAGGLLGDAARSRRRPSRSGNSSRRASRSTSAPTATSRSPRSGRRRTSRPKATSRSSRPPGSVFRYADLSGADGVARHARLRRRPRARRLLRRPEGRARRPRDRGARRRGRSGRPPRRRRRSTARTAAARSSSRTRRRPSGSPAPTAARSSDRESRAAEGPPSKFEVLEKLSAVPFRPTLPLGSEGTLDGHPYAVLGAVLKKTSSGGTDYFWIEYLLKETKSEAYHWLAESNGHWTLLEPVAAGGVTDGPRFADVPGPALPRLRPEPGRRRGRPRRVLLGGPEGRDDAGVRLRRAAADALEGAGEERGQLDRGALRPEGRGRGRPSS